MEPFCYVCGKDDKVCPCEEPTEKCRKLFDDSGTIATFRDLDGDVHGMYWFANIIRCMITNNCIDIPSEYADLFSVAAFVDTVLTYPETVDETTLQVVKEVEWRFGKSRYKNKFTSLTC
jgi:hypothetical protein